jgi:aryl carrier-like protein
MLTSRPTDTEIEDIIRRTIVELLGRAGKAVPDFDDDDELMATGLTSLDLAALVARLSRRWKIDPFLEAKTITEVRTVAELYSAYQECIKAS